MSAGHQYALWRGAKPASICDAISAKAHRGILLVTAHGLQLSRQLGIMRSVGIGARSPARTCAAGAIIWQRRVPLHPAAAACNAEEEAR